MTTQSSPLLSVVVPLYNEAGGVAEFHHALERQLAKLDSYRFEIIYCNDGSTDHTLQQLREIAADSHQVRVVSLSRNFGKEMATTAGLAQAHGQAVVTIDADGQHPVELIEKLVAGWEKGQLVVIGLRTNQETNFMKRLSSRWFYRLFNRFTGISLVPGATDFRLIDQAVKADFLRLTEHNRINRGLIDWLGYERTYVPFEIKARAHGVPGYSFKKLIKLAVDSVISLSTSPLYVTAYVGAAVLPLAVLLGVAMVGDAVLGDPMQWHATGGAYVMVLVLFLIGLLLMSQGIIGLYLSHIHSETQNRPLYIVDTQASVKL